MNKYKLIKVLMEKLKINYYEYNVKSNTLNIYEDIPVKTLLTIKKILNNTYINVNQKG